MKELIVVIDGDKGTVPIAIQYADGEKIIKRRNKFTKFDIPHPEIDFDARIHRVSIGRIYFTIEFLV